MNAQPAPDGRSWRGTLPAALLVVLVVLVYLPALDAGFVWLDRYEIVEGRMIVERWSDVPRRLFEPGNYAGYHRPLYDLVHSADRALWGLDPFGFHLSSVLLHAANVVLVFALTKRLVPRLGMRWAIAALWALHPLNTAAAGLIHAKADLLSTFFLLSCAGLFDAFVRTPTPGRRAAFLASGALAWAGALLAKETSFALPLCLAVALPWRELERAERRRWLAVTASLAASGGALLLARLDALTGLESPLSTPERLATFAVVAVDDVRRILGLAAPSLADTTTVWSALPLPQRVAQSLAFVVLALLAAAAWRRFPRTRAGLAVFAVFLLPVAQVVPLLHFRADRYLYLPSLGLLAALVVLVEAALRDRVTEPASRRLGAALTLTLLGLLGLRARARLLEFVDDETLFRAEIARVPDYREGLAALAVALDREGRFAEATPLHERALRRDPRRLSFADDSTLIVNFSRNLLARREPARVLELIDGHRASGPTVRPRALGVLEYNRSVALHQLGRYADFAETNREEASAWFLVAHAAREVGETERARTAWDRYRELAPEQADRNGAAASPDE